MTYDVRGSIWFGDIGIVRVYPEYGEPKYYIGKGQGLDRESDEQHIAAWGQKVHYEILAAFLQGGG